MRRDKGGAIRWGAVAVTVAITAGCTTATTGDETSEGPEPEFTGQEIDWEPCYDEDDLDDPELYPDERVWRAQMECGTITVPLDHDAPGGETIDLALARKPAEGDDDERIGSLVTNPGGPGISGVEDLGYPLYGYDIRTRFDIVSFDPRGVGASAGFACGDWEAIVDAQEAVAGEDPAELAEDDLDALEQAARGYAEECAAEVGEEFLANLGTTNVVHDLDLLRDALGEEELSFVGYSYGTYIGALYAEEYPDRVRALVLDGAVETDRANPDVAVEQAAGFQTAWEAFVADCAGFADCPFTDVASVEAEMDTILDAVDDNGYEVDGEPIASSYLRFLIGQALYVEETWDYAREALAAVDAGDAEEIDRSIDELYEVAYGYLYDDEEEYKEGEPVLDEEVALTAVNCADRADPTDIADYQDAAARAVEESPLFGVDIVWEQLPCAYWPETEPAPTGFTAQDAPPIVVIGTVGDPATPYPWAEELADQLASATLVTYEGNGHTIYGWGTSTCVDDAVDAYLLSGTLPEDGLSCPPVY